MGGSGDTSPVEVSDGVWRITLPTPWEVGPVNVYVVDDEPLTLLDTGQHSPDAVATLEAGLRGLGRRVEDLERIVVSHQHVDHWGLAATLAERSGAEVCALDAFAAWLDAYPASLHAEDRFAAALLRAHGGDPGGSGAEVYRGDQHYAAPVRPDRRLREGDVLEFARRRLRVHHRPGHSPSDTVLHDEERGVLFGADHVLAWPSIPLLSPPLDGAPADTRPHAFGMYLTSLHATSEMEVELIIPGHGEPIDTPGEVIADRLARYDRITERVRAAVGPDPRPALEIAGDVRGPVPEPHAFFALCDVLGHLDRLVAGGDVDEVADEDGTRRFVAA